LRHQHSVCAIGISCQRPFLIEVNTDPGLHDKLGPPPPPPPLFAPPPPPPPDAPTV
jgi:hypothetical protein